MEKCFIHFSPGHSIILNKLMHGALCCTFKKPPLKRVLLLGGSSPPSALYAYSLRTSRGDTHNSSRKSLIFFPSSTTQSSSGVRIAAAVHYLVLFHSKLHSRQLNGRAGKLCVCANDAGRRARITRRRAHLSACARR